MKYAISVDKTFPARHAVKLQNRPLEPMHEHLWHVKVTVGRASLDDWGIVMDFEKLADLLEQIIAPLRGQCINDIAPFAGPSRRFPSPTAECVAEWIADALIGRLPENVSLWTVQVRETEGCTAIFRPQSGG